MRFRILGDTSQGELRLFYDNITNELWYESGERVVFDHPKTDFLPPFDFVPEESSCKKLLTVAHLEIVLGLKCNFKCEYCSQKAIRDKGNDINPEKAMALIKHIEAVGLKVGQSIQLWGGEPLVYVKSLKVLIPELRRLFPDVGISMPSNGSLLTEDLIDFFTKYRVHYYVSTDGAPGTQRGEAVEDVPKLNILFKKAAEKMGRGFGFSTTPHQGTANAEKIIQFLKNKVPNVKVIGTHNVVRCHKYGVIPDSVFRMTNDQLKEYEDSIYSLLLNRENALIDRSLCRHADRLMGNLASGINNLALPGECGMPTSSAMVIDWEGNVYTCHSHTALDERVGNIDRIESVNNIGFTHWRHRKNCPTCPFLASCLGGCPRMGTKEYEISCPNTKALHKGIFRAVFNLIFGMKNLRIEPIEVCSLPSSAEI